MSNSLHTKYRPKSFDEVIGQAAIVKAMKSAIDRKTARAFLFNGPAGCGKTTLARISAYEVGCSDSSIMNVDAATNTGVDNVREIQEVIRYKPMGDSSVRGIIVDECHMLSKQAWNSLLTVVEEPPSYVYWFFCTTEVDKVPKTIVTRCKNLKLSLLSDVALEKVVKNALKGEKEKLKDSIVKLIISEAHGSARQALQNLDSCIGVTNTKEAARILETAADSKDVIDLCRLLISGGASWTSAMEIINRIKDPNPESIRIVVCAYTAAVLKNQKSAKQVQNLLAILDAFEGYYNPSEKLAPLLLSIGRVLYG